MPVIKKQVLLDAFYNYPNYTWTTIALLEKIEQLPTIEAVPVVLCKDCRWKLWTHCTRFENAPVTNEDYCSKGERRTDDKRTEH